MSDIDEWILSGIIGLCIVCAFMFITVIVHHVLFD